MPIAVEYVFNVDIGGVKLTGRIDRVDKMDNGALSIVDYKTNKDLFTKDELEQDLQLSLYQLAAEQMWHLPVGKLTFYHLRSNTPCCCGSRNRERLEEASRLVLRVAEAIAKGEFPAVENKYCPYYQHKYSKTIQEDTEANILHGAAVEEIVERYVYLQSQIKALESELLQLRQMLIDCCQAEGLNRVYGKEYAIIYKLVSRTGFDLVLVKANPRTSGTLA